MKSVDGTIIDDLRNQLFGAPTKENLLDLASLNIQRGRDHGLSKYNDMREAYGLKRKQTFMQVNKRLSNKLETVYSHPDEIDAWVGCICEEHLENSQIGELATTIIVEQFTRMRDGDRFWYLNDSALTEEEKKIITNTTLSDVIKRNTTLSNVKDDVFVF